MANHLYRGSNTLAEVLPNVQPGTRVFKFDPGSGGYFFQEFNPSQGGWVPNPLETLHPGEGAWIQSPVPQTLNFIGISVAPPTRPRLPAGRYFVSCPAPQPASFEVLMGFPPIVGDQVIQYTNVYPSVPQPPAQASSVHTFGPGGWDVVPTVPLGKSVFVDLAPVPPSNAPPQLAPLYAQVIHVGMTVQFAATATDPDLPPNQLTFSLDPGAPPTAFIDSLTGAFSWTPTDADAELIHDITVRVTDNGSPPLSATQMFSVVVMPRTEESIQLAGNLVTLTWSSIPGTFYRILRAPHLTGPWTNVGPDVLATNVTTTKEDTFSPTIPEGYYQITTTTSIPLTNVGAFCVLLKNIVGGPGLTADSVAPPAGEVISTTKEKVPLIVTGEDRDQLIQTCVCYGFGGICPSSRAIDIMDGVSYAWTVTGDGTLTGDGPAVLYLPRDLMVGETNLATVKAEITESRGNDAKATITYTVQVVREEECKYKRTVTIAKVVPPGAPVVVTSSGCLCVPIAPVWIVTPPLAAAAPAELKVCAGERLVLSASGADDDHLFLTCLSSGCGLAISVPMLIDELKYTWSATLGTFPDYGGAPISNSRRTSVIYKAPDSPDADDMVTIQVADSGAQATDAMVTNKIKIIVRKADLQIHKPPVLDSAEPMIPEADELCKGAQTFVNLDNDDKDDKYDTSTTDTDVTSENEMVKLILRIEPKAATGIAKLTAPEGAANIKVWTNAMKKGEYVLGTALAVPTVFTEVGNGWEKMLWVEGITAHTNQRQTKLKLTYEETGLKCEDDAALTIIGVKKLTWLGRTNGFTAGGLTHDNNTLDADPNFPTGAGQPESQRVFPDGRAPAFDVFRDKVGLEVELTVQPIEDVNIYVKVFDVDDPTSAAAPIDPNDSGASGTYVGTALTYTAEEDNRGEVGGKKAGELAGQDADGIATLTFTMNDLKKTNEFTVSHFAGDNYRAVANGDKDFLKELRNVDQDDGVRVVEKNVTGTAAEREVREAGKYCSPVLTVWRLLHVERDSMMALTNNANNARGKVESLTAATKRVGLDSTDLFLNNEAVATLDDTSEDEDDGKDGRFQNGSLTGLTAAGVKIKSNGNLNFTLDAAATVAFTITKGTNTLAGDMTDLAFAGTESTLTVGGIVMTNDQFKDGTVTIRGVGYGVKGNTAGTVVTTTKVLIDFIAVDDDDNSVLPNAGYADTSLMAQGFMAAYILPINDGGGAATNDTTTVVSTVNMPNAQPAFEAFFLRDSAPNEKDSFWVVYVLSTFQDTPNDDWDSDGTAGEGGTGGVTWSLTSTSVLKRGGQGSSANRETIRDRLTNGTKAKAGLEARVITHEVGHQFGLGHNTDIMFVTNQDGPLGAAFHFSNMDQNLLRGRVKSPGE